MPISKTKRLFGGTKLTFKCPTCGATMPITSSTRLAGNELACRSCAKVHTLSSADITLVKEQLK